MNKLLLAATASALLAPGIAQAADWTGWYAGAQLGYGDASTNSPPLGGDGGFLGFTGGYDYDFGTTVIGAALDYDFANISLLTGLDIKNISRLKFRLGYDTGPALVYLSAGAANANVDQFGWNNGYYGGLGVDFLLDPNFSLGVELLSHRFSDVDGSGIDVDVGTAAVRAVFRF